MRTTPTVGTIIAGRFELAQVAGSGGMGTVYRARDRYTGEWVALKLLHKSSSSIIEPRRFAREARILSQLRHPGIVGYVDSGQTTEGLRYLVMEWLEGEDLARRLERGPLSVHECLLMMKQVASALSHAHQAGIVHRDIKPSNLFLTGGSFERLVLLDFGVAHYDEIGTQSALTLAGDVVGTLEYMAPEQVQGEHHIGAAADIYSLGCVAYQSLSGRSRRSVEHFAAALVRAMYEQEPPLSKICPWVPEAVSALLARMMSKDASRRPQDGAELLRELDALVTTEPETPPSIKAPISAEVHSGEQNLYSIVLAVPTDPTRSLDRVPSQESLIAELSARRALEDTLVNHGAHPRWLPDGSLLLTMIPSESAHDQAILAAHCAILLKQIWPDAAVAMATGRGQLAGQGLIGEVVDRAARLLRARSSVTAIDMRVDAIHATSVWVDDLSASLLGRRFVLMAVPGGAIITGELRSSDEARSVLGTQTPCLGREQELTFLDAIFERCQEDSEAQAVLFTGAPGLGKTRLWQEFLNRVRRRSRPVTVILSIGENLSAGAPYALLRQGLRRLCALEVTGELKVARQRLADYCAGLLGEAGGQRVLPFLAEVCGLALPTEESAELKAARGDPKAMAAHVLTAVSALLGAVCDLAPLIWVLDDLHWGDLLTVNLVDGILRELGSRPLLVLGLGRPELKTTFQKIRQWPNVKDIPLDGLSRAASERLIHFVLGDSVNAAAVTRIGQHAAGNPLLLEELIRAEHEGHSDQLPETVLAILLSRMQGLELRARVVLEIASVFGQRFWRGGVLAILAVAQIELDLDAALAELRQGELITTSKQSSIREEPEWSFRHPLMREAAYTLLSDEQKRSWHGAAGAYIEKRLPGDDLMLAEHYSRSEEPGRACPYFVRAALMALEGDDLGLALTYTRRGLTSHPESELLGELLSVQTLAQYRAGDLEACLRSGEEALRLLPRGGASYCHTMHPLLTSTLMLGQREAQRRYAADFAAAEPTPDAIAAYVETGSILSSTISIGGQREFCKQLLAKMELRSKELLGKDLAVTVWLRHAQYHMARVIDGNPWAALCAIEEAATAAQRSGNRRWSGSTLGEQALLELELGSQTSQPKLHTALATLRMIDSEVSPAYLSASMAIWQASQPELAERAIKLAQTVLTRHKHNALYGGYAQLAISLALLHRGDAAGAESAVRESLALMRPMPLLSAGALTQLSQVLLAQGRVDEAKQNAESGLSQLEALGGTSLNDLKLRLVLVEARQAAGEKEGALETLRTALQVLEARAALIPDAAWRKRYLENVGEHARLRRLGTEHLRKGSATHIESLPTGG